MLPSYSRLSSLWSYPELKNELTIGSLSSSFADDAGAAKVYVLNNVELLKTTPERTPSNELPGKMICPLDFAHTVENPPAFFPVAFSTV